MSRCQWLLREALGGRGALALRDAGVWASLISCSDGHGSTFSNHDFLICKVGAMRVSEVGRFIKSWYHLAGGGAST